MVFFSKVTHKLTRELSPPLRQYLLITANYWAFTLTDGALRMLVLLYFHQLGYAPLDIALLFLFYEIFGVITNLVGGWLGARFGLNKTMNAGLAIQIMALSMLLLPTAYLSLGWVMAVQGLSGIAKDLNKMSAKSAIKLLVPDNAQGTLYRWVAFVTGSKNACKGMGFFLGGARLTLIGFKAAIVTMIFALTVVWLLSLRWLKKDLGKIKVKPRFMQIISNNRAVNFLSAARLFLFSARDVWFVVALPVYLATNFHWSPWQVGGFLALWVIAYGFVQGIAPRLTHRKSGNIPAGPVLVKWTAALSLTPGLIALALGLGTAPEGILLGGLLVFGFLFAINSSLHSFLIVSYTTKERVSMDVGFYYMANALGRLLGTVLSGYIYQAYNLQACLWLSMAFLLIATLLSLALPALGNTKRT